MEFMARGRQWRGCIAAGRVCSDRLKRINYKRTAQRGQATQRPADLIGEIEGCGEADGGRIRALDERFSFRRAGGHTEGHGDSRVAVRINRRAVKQLTFRQSAA
jgi:hypothetical protein